MSGTGQYCTLAQLGQVLSRLSGGESVFPSSLQEPFAALDLSPQEHLLLTAEVQGLASAIIAGRLRIDQPTLRQRRKRLRQKLYVPEAQTLAAWAEQWWNAQNSLLEHGKTQ